jgi:hypothetical protein
MKTAWLALLLLGSISAVAAMLTGSWRAPAVADTAPAQAIALAEPADDNLVKASTWPDMAARRDAARQDLETARQEEAAREVVDPDPTPVLRGRELPAARLPVAADPTTNANANMNIISRHWHAAGANKMPAPNAQQIKRIRESKAEMLAKRSKAAADAKLCATPSSPLQILFRKLSQMSLSPACPS